MTEVFYVQQLVTVRVTALQAMLEPKAAFTPNLFGAVQMTSSVFAHLVQFISAGVIAVN